MSVCIPMEDRGIRSPEIKAVVSHLRWVLRI